MASELHWFNLPASRFIVSYGGYIESAPMRRFVTRRSPRATFVSGFLILLIVPWSVPLWMLAIAIAFAVIFAKVVFGGSGYNISSMALVTWAFSLFFAYPADDW